jgi:hypothetical protein
MRAPSLAGAKAYGQAQRAARPSSPPITTAGNLREIDSIILSQK